MDNLENFKDKCFDFISSQLNIENKLEIVDKELRKIYESYNNMSAMKLRRVTINEKYTIKESCLLSDFKFDELSKESWITSKLRLSLLENQFTFFVYQYFEGILYFRGYYLWKMPLSIIENEVKLVWQDTVDKINGTLKLERVGNQVRNNFISKSDNLVIHIRPHASQSSYVESKDADNLPAPPIWKNKPDNYSSDWMTKQSFWINNDFLLEITKESKNIFSLDSINLEYSTEDNFNNINVRESIDYNSTPIYNIYYLRKYGISNRFIDELIKNNITDVVEFKEIFDNHYSLNKTIERLKNKFPNINIVITEEISDSIYLLNNFFGSGSISDFWANKGYKTLSSLKGKSIEELLKIPNVGLKKAQKTFNAIKIIFSDTFVFKMKYQNNQEVLEKVREKQRKKKLEDEFLSSIDAGDVIDIPENISLDFINQQVLEKKIVIVGTKARRYFISVKEFLDSEFKYRDVLIDKISGKTLQDIGDNFRVSRERVRQILKKIEIPITYEEYLYKDIFCEYNFTLEEFIELFQVSPEVYGILKEKFMKGIKPSYEYVWYNNFSQEFKNRYLDKNNLYYSFRNRFEKKSPSTMFNEILFTNKEKIFTPTSMLQELSYETKERNIQGYVSRSNYAIESKNSQFRFYDNNIATEDIEKLKRIFDLPSGIYHNKMIYDLNKVLMDDLEILDGYELANLLKRIGYEYFSLNKIVRQVEFYIGYNDKHDFFDDMLLNYDGVELEEIGLIVEGIYGINSGNTVNYLWREYSDFIYKNKINIDIDKPSNEDFYCDLLENLGDEIYTLEEVQEITKKLTDNKYNLSQGILNKIGYTMRQSYVVRNDFTNITQAVDSIIFKNDFYEYHNTAVEKSQFFKIRLTRLQEEYKLFRISKNKYVSGSRAKLDAELLSDFFDKTIKYGKSNRWFTYYSMISDGFSHELIDLGFDDIFYESLLKITPKMKYIQTIHPVFMVTNESLTLEKFLTEYLVECVSVDVYDMLDDIKNIYGLDISKDKVKWALCNGGAYYSDPMNKFYSTKEQYLKEIYR